MNIKMNVFPVSYTNEILLSKFYAENSIPVGDQLYFSECPIEWELIYDAIMETIGKNGNFIQHYWIKNFVLCPTNIYNFIVEMGEIRAMVRSVIPVASSLSHQHYVFILYSKSVFLEVDNKGHTIKYDIILGNNNFIDDTSIDKICFVIETIISPQSLRFNTLYDYKLDKLYSLFHFVSHINKCLSRGQTKRNKFYKNEIDKLHNIISKKEGTIANLKASLSNGNLKLYTLFEENEKNKNVINSQDRLIAKLRKQNLILNNTLQHVLYNVS